MSALLGLSNFSSGAKAHTDAACRVAVVERGPLKGRDQEWNISRKELNELVSCAHSLWQVSCVGPATVPACMTQC